VKLLRDLELITSTNHLESNLVRIQDLKQFLTQLVPPLLPTSTPSTSPSTRTKIPDHKNGKTDHLLIKSLSLQEWSRFNPLATPPLIKDPPLFHAPADEKYKSLVLPILIAQQSKIHGLGIFAKTRLPKGTIWWVPDPTANIIFISEQQWKEVEEKAKARLLAATSSSSSSPPLTLASVDPLYHVIAHFGYPDEVHNRVNFLLDDSRFCNHSDTPNSGASKSNRYASETLVDIEVGEEIVEDYRLYGSLPWFLRHAP